jgi:hypothetical protein
VTGRPGVVEPVVMACPFLPCLGLAPVIDAMSGISANERDRAALRPVVRFPSFL